MNSSDAPVRAIVSSSSPRICAWTVTSSAVVGSSAVISDGELARAIATTTRWRCPPDKLVRVGPGRPPRVREPDLVKQAQDLGRDGLPGRARTVQADDLGDLW
jgi:hypothetical protein